MTRRLALIVALASGFGSATAQAAEFQITSAAEGLGSCAPGSATCTIRQAIVDAKGTAGRDTLRVPPGTYVNTAADFIVAIGEQLDVVGTDPRTTIFQEVSGGDGRVFLVEQDASLRLRGVTVTGGTGASGVLLFGGGNELQATDTVFTGNSAARGGAINVTGTASVVLDRVTLHGNTATERGGAIRLADAGGSLSVSRSTISANSAPLGAGIAVQGGTASLAQSTETDGVDLAPGATVQARASVVGPCTGTPVASLGATAGPCFGVDPLLGPLADNGGPTPTRHPLDGSPLLDADPACPAGEIDQRGVARPQGPACDIGAVEVAVAAAMPGPAPTPTPTPAGPAAAPRITGLRLASRRIGARTVRRRGARVTVRLSAPAVVRIRVERRSRGRWVLLSGAVQRTVRSGSATLAVKRSLRPGPYRVSVRVRAPGSRSAFSGASRRSLRVVR